MIGVLLENQNACPLITSCARCFLFNSTLFLAYVKVRLLHHAKSWTVVGPLLIKYRLPSSAMAASRSIDLTFGERSSSKAYVNCFPLLGPLQISPSNSASMIKNPSLM